MAKGSKRIRTLSIPSLVGSKKSISFEVGDTYVKGIITSFKADTLTIEEAFMLTGIDTLGVNGTYITDSALSYIVDKIKDHGVKRNKVSFVFPTLGGAEKVIKCPPLDKNTVNSLIDESYTKFFAGQNDFNSIRGTEYLGDTKSPKGEMYYFISTAPKQNLLDISTQIEQKKVSIDTIYNEVLALTNVLSLIAVTKHSKCLLFSNNKRIYIVYVKNDTLIFHRNLDIDKAKNTGVKGIIVPTVPIKEPPLEALEEHKNTEIIQKIKSNIIPDVISTLDFLRVKEGAEIDEILVAGDLTKLPDIVSVLSFGIGQGVRKLNLEDHSDKNIHVTNQTTEDIELDYVIPLGLALKGVVK